MPAPRANVHVISASRRIDAPPERVYAVIADYHRGHPRIVPDAFSDLTVERGGVGAGTVIRFTVKMLGRTTAFRAEITEPEPGRRLVERNVLGNEGVTTFLVDPAADGLESDVTISTEMPVRGGMAGSIERYLLTRVLTPLYEEELRRLGSVVQWFPDGAAA